MARKNTGRRKAGEREKREAAAYEVLKAALEERGWSVAVARTLDGRGGHCIVRGERRVLLAGRLPVADRVEMLADLAADEGLDVASLAVGTGEPEAAAVADA